MEKREEKEWGREIGSGERGSKRGEGGKERGRGIGSGERGSKREKEGKREGVRGRRRERERK